MPSFRSPVCVWRIDLFNRLYYSRMPGFSIFKQYVSPIIKPSIQLLSQGCFIFWDQFFLVSAFYYSLKIRVWFLGVIFSFTTIFLLGTPEILIQLFWFVLFWIFLRGEWSEPNQRLESNWGLPRLLVRWTLCNLWILFDCVRLNDSILLITLIAKFLSPCDWLRLGNHQTCTFGDFVYCCHSICSSPFWWMVNGKCGSFCGCMGMTYCHQWRLIAALRLFHP